MRRQGLVKQGDHAQQHTRRIINVLFLLNHNFLASEAEGIAEGINDCVDRDQAIVEEYVATCANERRR